MECLRIDSSGRVKCSECVWWQRLWMEAGCTGTVAEYKDCIDVELGGVDCGGVQAGMLTA